MKNSLLNYDSVNEFICHQDEDIYISMYKPLPYKVSLHTGICCSVVDFYDFNTKPYSSSGQPIMVGAHQQVIFVVRCNEPQECNIERRMTFIPNPSEVSSLFKKITVLP